MAAVVAMTFPAFASDAPVSGRIETALAQGEDLTFTAWVTARKAVAVEAELRVDRAGPSGTVSSVQTSDLTLISGQTSSSATISVNVPEAHSASATLRLTVDGALVFETTEVYP